MLKIFFLIESMKKIYKRNVEGAKPSIQSREKVFVCGLVKSVPALAYLVETMHKDFFSALYFEFSTFKVEITKI